jgi:hypothetical protein
VVRVSRQWGRTGSEEVSEGHCRCVSDGLKVMKKRKVDERVLTVVVDCCRGGCLGRRQRATRPPSWSSTGSNSQQQPGAFGFIQPPIPPTFEPPTVLVDQYSLRILITVWEHGVGSPSGPQRDPQPGRGREEPRRSAAQAIVLFTRCVVKRNAGDLG